MSKGELGVHLLKVGLDYVTAPIEIREQFTFPDDKLELAKSTLNKQKSVLETIILSTCNRTELYVVVDQLHTGRYYVKQFLADWFEKPMEMVEDYIQITENDDTVKHLFRVISGLQSMVLGETQILGQLRHAFLTAQAVGTSGTVFNELFKQAITFAKRVHSETGIAEHTLSISNAALKLLEEERVSIAGNNILLIGAGEMAKLTLKNLIDLGYQQIVIVNRSFTKALSLANKYGVKAMPYADLQVAIDHAQIIISATSAGQEILTRNNFTETDEKTVIDLAVPRDVAGSVKALEQINLYDVDDFQDIITENMASREKAAREIELLIEVELDQFKAWLARLGIVPILRELREKAIRIQTETFESIKRKIPSLTEREEKVINKHTKSIINQLLKEPIIQAKEMAGKTDSETELATFIDIFGLDEALKKN